MFASTKAILAKLDGLAAQNAVILKNQEISMADLTKLQADVTAQTTVIQSAVTLLEGLNAELKAAGTDPVALAALSTSIESNTAALSAAIAASAPAPAPIVPPAAPAT